MYVDYLFLVILAIKVLRYPGLEQLLRVIIAILGVAEIFQDTFTHIMKTKVFSKPYWLHFAILLMYLLVEVTWHSIKITLNAKELYAVIYTVSPKE